MTERTRDYDVAVSFLKEDEPLALQVRESLAPLKVFVYTKEQERIVGNDGVGVFRDVFRSNATVVLVLWRPGWGETPWTRVEATAIRDYCLEAGWDRMVFVRLTRDGAIPKWVPDSYIYLDAATFGVGDLAGLTKAKALQHGVELKAPTAADRARQLAERERFSAQTKQLLMASPQPFYEACAPLFDALNGSFDTIAQAAGWKVVKQSTCTPGFHAEFVARAAGVSLSIVSRDVAANMSLNSRLIAQVFRGAILTRAEQQAGTYVLEQPKKVDSIELKLTRTPEFGWSWQAGVQHLSADSAAARIIESFMAVCERMRGS